MAAFGHDPAQWYGGSLADIYADDPAELATLQLGALAARLTSLRDHLPALGQMADMAGISTIDRLGDVVPLLFDHAVYKSYPAALLTRGRFDAMTRWLARLTTVDLGGVDLGGCTTIDDWIIRLEQQTELTLCHSSGTTGTMSFLPWTQQEYARAGAQLPVLYLAEGTTGEAVDVIYPFYRSGAGSQMRWNEQYLSQFCKGDEARFHALYPGRASADLLSLAGRLQNARTLGQTPPPIPGALQTRFADFLRARANGAAETDRFLAATIESLRGKRVFMAAPWTYLHPLAVAGLQRGERAVFDPGSIILTGGGAKGMKPPDGWEEQVCAFAGVDRLSKGYAMSELSAIFPMCALGHYHVPPWIIPFVLDPRTGKPLTGPAETGQAAFFDLLPDTRWGGFTTGDKITLYRGQDCGCGKRGAYLDAAIDRLGAGDGGDDKITCAATVAAYEDIADTGAPIWESGHAH
ncbi:hypothetical protein [Novosphingobium sp.]|uniref:hypothetical protein n=1 Tax=Novosphingobium sp. TaxID=1874826 RepID=UPI003BAD4690